MVSSGRESQQKSEGWSVLWSLVGSYKTRIVLLSGVSFLGAMLEAVFVVGITGLAVALVAGQSQVGPVAGHSIPVSTALILLAVALGLRLALNILAVRISTQLTADVTTDQRSRLSDAYLCSTWAIQESEPAGRLQELLTSFVQRITTTLTTATSAIRSLLSLVAFVVTGLAVDAILTLVVLAFLAVVGAGLAPIRRRIRARSRASVQANLAFANAVAELGSLGLEMQTFGVQERFSQRVNELTRTTTRLQRQVGTLQGSLAPTYIALAYAGLLSGVAVLAVIGFDNLAAISGVTLLMVRSLGYAQQLVAASGSIAASVPFLAGVRDTVARYEASPASTGTTIPSDAMPLEAHGVGFSYSADRPALADISFRIDKGEAVGMIGSSGAGKSTLAQLLLDLRAPTSGKITACGVNLVEIDRSWWSSRVAFVAQDPRLFTGTVAENIRFFREGIDDDALRRAASQANVLTDIEGLPRGFDTHLGERGSQLSGGQRQRLSIARALVGEPDLLVLDEPTSALDGRSEALIRDSLADLHGGMTVVMIAHRMSTLDLCDRIMVIEAGKLTAFDTPEELRQTSEFYRGALAMAGISPGH